MQEKNEKEEWQEGELLFFLKQKLNVIYLTNN